MCCPQEQRQDPIWGAGHSRKNKSERAFEEMHGGNWGGWHWKDQLDSVLKTVDIGPGNVGLVFLGRRRALHRLEQSPDRNPAFVLFLLFSWLSLSSLFGQDWIDLWKEFYFKQGRSSRRSLKRKSSQNTKKRRKFSRILCILSRKRKNTCITSSCRQKLYKVMWSFYFLFSYKTNLCTFMTV